MSWTSAYLKISILFVEDLELSIQYYCQFGMDEIFLTMHISINIYSFSSLRISVGLQELCLESFGIKATAEQCSQMENTLQRVNGNAVIVGYTIMILLPIFIILGV